MRLSGSGRGQSASGSRQVPGPSRGGAGCASRAGATNQKPAIVIPAGSWRESTGSARMGHAGLENHLDPALSTRGRRSPRRATRVAALAGKNCLSDIGDDPGACAADPLGCAFRSSSGRRAATPGPSSTNKEGNPKPRSTRRRNLGAARSDRKPPESSPAGSTAH